MQEKARPDLYRLMIRRRPLSRPICTPARTWGSSKHYESLADYRSTQITLTWITVYAENELYRLNQNVDSALIISLDSAYCKPVRSLFYIRSPAVSEIGGDKDSRKANSKCRPADPV